MRTSADLIELTRRADLLTPPSLHWEIGNAFSAMFKRRRISLKQAQTGLELYEQIPIRFSKIELDRAIELANGLGIYTYDAYFLCCALKHDGQLVTLDHGLGNAAHRAGLTVMEVSE